MVPSTTSSRGLCRDDTPANTNCMLSDSSFDARVRYSSVLRPMPANTVTNGASFKWQKRKLLFSIRFSVLEKMHTDELLVVFFVFFDVCLKLSEIEFLIDPYHALSIGLVEENVAFHEVWT